MLLILWLIKNFVHEILRNDFLNVAHDSIRCCFSPSINVHDDVTAMWLLWRHWWQGWACCSSWSSSWLCNVSSDTVRLGIQYTARVYGPWTKYRLYRKILLCNGFLQTVREDGYADRIAMITAVMSAQVDTSQHKSTLTSVDLSTDSVIYCCCCWSQHETHNKFTNYYIKYTF